jgi:hypothetical protein
LQNYPKEQPVLQIGTTFITDYFVRNTATCHGFLKGHHTTLIFLRLDSMKLGSDRYGQQPIKIDPLPFTFIEVSSTCEEMTLGFYVFEPEP